MDVSMYLTVFHTGTSSLPTKRSTKVPLKKASNINDSLVNRNSSEARFEEQHQRLILLGQMQEKGFSIASRKTTIKEEKNILLLKLDTTMDNFQNDLMFINSSGIHSLAGKSVLKFVKRGLFITIILCFSMI